MRGYSGPIYTAFIPPEAGQRRRLGLFRLDHPAVGGGFLINRATTILGHTPEVVFAVPCKAHQ